MFLEEAIKKTTERMEAFRHRAMVALGKEFQIDESDKEREREMVAQEVGDEAVKRLGRVWEIDPSEIMNAEHRIVYEGRWNPLSSPYLYTQGDEVTMRLGGDVVNLASFDESGFTLTEQERQQERAQAAARKFELTNELYHLVMDCTEIILDYCRARNIRPDYHISFENNSKFINVGVRRSWLPPQQNYRLEDKSGLPGLEDFLRRAYE